MKVLPIQANHRLVTEATPTDVWAVLSDPASWPKFDPLFLRVTGAASHTIEGQRLLAITRLFPLRVPVNVEKVLPRKALELTIYLMPGLRQRVEWMLLPSTRGGTHITMKVSVEGPLAGALWLPNWWWSGVSVRLLARCADKERRRRRAVARA